MIQILVDSGANIPALLCEEYNITVIPFLNYVDEKPFEAFIPGLTPEEERAKAKEFYDGIRAGAEVKTSLVNMETFEKYFTEGVRAGNELIYISMSKNISGTYNSARLAAESVLDEHEDAKIFLVDSKNASMGQGLLAIYAKMLIDKNVAVEEIVAVLEDTVEHMNGVFTVDNLKYLAKSGRISNFKSVAGNVLNIKPMLKGSQDGFIVQFKNIRGRKKALEELVNACCDNIVCAEKQILAITHADAYEEACFVRDKILEKVAAAEFIDTPYDYCTGSHAGPGAIAIFFIAKDRELTGEKTEELPKLFAYL